MSEKVEKCPFPQCGNVCEVHGGNVGHWAWVACTGCNYQSIAAAERFMAIAAHNELCRKLRFAEKAKGPVASLVRTVDFANESHSLYVYILTDENSESDSRLLVTPLRAALKELEAEDG